MYITVLPSQLHLRYILAGNAHGDLRVRCPVHVHRRWRHLDGLHHDVHLSAGISQSPTDVHISGTLLAIFLMFPSNLCSNSNFDLPISQYLQTRFDKRMRLFGSILFTFATVSLHAQGSMSNRGTGTSSPEISVHPIDDDDDDVSLLCVVRKSGHIII